MMDADQILEQSRTMFADELDSFVPDQVFDAHFEMWDEREQDHFKGSVGVALPTRFSDIQAACDWLHPGRQVGAAFIPFSFKPELIASVNEWASAQTRASGDTCCTYFFVTPADDPEWVRQEVRRLGAIGLKG